MGRCREIALRCKMRCFRAVDLYGTGWFGVGFCPTLLRPRPILGPALDSSPSEIDGKDSEKKNFSLVGTVFF